MRRGMLCQRNNKDSGGGYSNLWAQWGKAKCQRENPSNCQIPIFSLMPNHLILPEIGWVSYCMGWARYGSPNLNLGKHPFWGKWFLTYGASYCPKMLPIPSCIFPTFLELLSTLIHVFAVSCVFSPWLGSCFVNSQWLGSLLGIFVVVFLITQLGKMFLGCTMSGRRDPLFLGVVEFVLAMLGP